MCVGQIVSSGASFALISTIALFAFDAPSEPLVAEGLVMPVVLKQKIDTAKAHPGEIVKFELLSPVMANHEVVAPASAKVYGRIVEAHPLGNNPFSSLAVVIESIAWKNHTLLLHAHLAGFGKMKVTYFGRQYNCDQALGIQDERVPTRGSSGRLSDPMRSMTRSAPRLGGYEPQCDSIAAQTETDSKAIEHIRLRRTVSKLVPVAFASTKRDIVLKKGTLLVIRNGPEPVTMGAASNQNKLPRQ